MNKTDFKTVMDPSKFGGDITFNNKKPVTALLSLGFKAVKKCRIDVRFSVLVNDKEANWREVDVTEVEDFIRIPFETMHGDKITLEATNNTDVTDIEITYQHIGS